VQEREPVAIQVTASTEVQALVETNRAIIEKQARVSAIEFPALWNLGPVNTRTTASFTIGTPYEKQIDVAVERERLRKKLEQYEKVLVNAERQLGNEAFLAKAPEKVVSGLKKQASEASTLRQETLDAIEKLEQLA
jgi:valyl-tRNA synthetase